MADDSDPSLDINIRTTAHSSGVQDAQRDISGLTNRVREVDTAFNRAASGIDKASSSLHGVGEGVRATKEIFHGLEQASEGGVNAVLGLGHALSGVSHLMHFLKSSFVEAFVALLPVISPVVIALGTVKLVLMDIVKSAEEDLKLAFSHVGEQTDILKQKNAELEASTKASIESQVAEVNKLKVAYAGLVSTIDKVEFRNKTVKDAQLELALSKEPTEEGKQAVRDRFKQNELLSEQENAKVRREAANTQLSRLSQQRFGAEVDVHQKQFDSDEAFKAVRGLGSRTDQEAMTLRTQARIAQDALVAAQKILDAIDKEQSGGIDQATGQIDAANLTGEVAPLKLQALQNNQVKVKFDGGAGGPARTDLSKTQAEIDANSARADALQSANDKNFSGFTIGGNAAQKEIAALRERNSSLQDFISASNAKDDEATQLFKKGMKDKKKTEEQLKNIRPGN